MANDLMFLSRQVLEHSHALLIARLKFLESEVSLYRAAIGQVEDHDPERCRHLDESECVHEVRLVARDALKGTTPEGENSDG